MAKPEAQVAEALDPRVHEIVVRCQEVIRRVKELPKVRKVADDESA